jgi:hypothetical protein
MNGGLRVMPESTQKKRATEKGPVLLEMIYVVKRMFIEKLTIKAILMRSQMESRNKILETGRKIIFVVSSKELNHCTHILRLHGRQNLSH